MPGTSYTIRATMSAVLVIALAFAALRSPSPEAAGATLAVARIFLSAAMVGILLLTGRRRIFCIGFTLVGWGHLLSCYTSVVRHASWFPSIYLLDSYIESMHLGKSYNESYTRWATETWIALSSLLLAAVGGWIAVHARHAATLMWGQDEGVRPTAATRREKRSTSEHAVRLSSLVLVPLVLLLGLELLRGSVRIGVSRRDYLSAGAGPRTIISCYAGGRCREEVIGHYVKVGPFVVDY